ncbi:rifin PIR protein, putative [Plasmodium reichenowi]|uniref:Rifin PIR protein, putative n=1 Tax=Plasmodium reichenowi TaxID=5854 RepID=A0A2P9D441_PLARE|nr:rifin PIR protein, putative [Plasmodium reichenowi]
MKVHYINILLFPLPLNILVNTHNKNSSITNHTYTNRSLCECDIYEPANYDNDPQMKKVMDNFNRQTSQRFEEYDERMKSKRMQCKEQCDKEIQKIILKDKLEKELMDKFATLETKITTDDIPTCICEKSLADKVEKGCLRCGGVLGGGVAPGVGLFGAVAVDQLTSVLTADATKYATKKGIEAGVKAVIEKITEIKPIFTTAFNGEWSNFIKPSNYNTVDGLYDAVTTAIKSTGKSYSGPSADPLVSSALSNREATFGKYVTAGQEATASTTENVKNTALGTIESTTTTSTNAIISAVVAIEVIILIMVIIYLILRYRRKKKMKKKLQYIKLLEE